VPGEALLSDAWLESCNAALRTLEVAPGTSLVVTEIVTGAPAGLHGSITLVADVDGVRLVTGDDDAASAWITLGIGDAEALHEGRLNAARALTEGRIRVRGDLRAVVDAGALLAQAHDVMRER